MEFKASLFTSIPSIAISLYPSCVAGREKKTKKKGRNPLADAFSMFFPLITSQGMYRECHPIKAKVKNDRKDVGLKSHLIKLCSAEHRLTKEENDNKRE